MQYLPLLQTSLVQDPTQRKTGQGFSSPTFFFLHKQKCFSKACRKLSLHPISQNWVTRPPSKNHWQKKKKIVLMGLDQWILNLRQNQDSISKEEEEMTVGHQNILTPQHSGFGSESRQKGLNSSFSTSWLCDLAQMTQYLWTLAPSVVTWGMLISILQVCRED